MTDNSGATPAGIKPFSIPGLLNFEEDAHGLIRAKITSLRCEATIYLHGAHVTHWQPRGEDAVLFVSGESHFEAGKPIRGGIPIVFPWFSVRANDPAAPPHGWARLSEWQIESTRQVEGDVEITLRLDSKNVPAAEHACSLRYRIRAGLCLQLELEVTNEGTTPFRFEEALHTYFSVRDIRSVSVEGLEGLPFSTKLPDRNGEAGNDKAIRFATETDYIYQESRPAVSFEDPAARRRIVIEKNGSGSTVVWNPWIEKAAAMPDFGDDEWPSMLCIETANIGETAVELAPGATHVMMALLKVEH